HSSTGGVGTNTTGALSNGRAVIATEFGTCNASGNGGYNESATDAWFTLLETNKVSWVNWSITSKDETASIFTNGGTGRAGNASNWSPTSKPALSTSGAYINGKLKSYNSAYFNTAYAIAATAGAGGRVTKSPDKATYDFGDKVTITAVPDDGYEFAMWEGDAVGVGTTISYRVVGLNVSAKATFVQGSMVKNGFFVSNIANWVGSAATISHEDGALKAVVSSPSSGSAVRQGSINMVTGRKYELTFKAKAASGTAVITPRMTNTNLDRDYIKEPQAITLTGDWKEYKVEFMMCFRNNQNVLLSDDKAVLYFACGANGVQTWHLDDVVLNDVGSTPDCLAGPVAWSVRDIGRAGWSIAKFGAAWQLRGPASGAGAKAYIYDTRGKAVKSMAAADGLTLGKGMPAGSYFLVIKNSAGAEAFRSKITVVR
ncbi:MAG: carbohydrate binding domain-containing protein, partial [Chitinispirillales bacterium]|nr:carbohydrate binding domain-containing protein [Chitinispirillales bacterium]